MMASACVNNVGVPPESFPPACHSNYGWLTPRVSHSPKSDASVESAPVELPRSSADLDDFEFRFDEVPVTMLPADELFSNGKLVPLHLTALRPSADPAAGEILSLEQAAKPWICAEGIGTDAFVLSPKAPRCTTRWRELLGLKRLQNTKKDPSKAASPMPAASPRSVDLSTVAKSPSRKSFKHLLHRHLKTSVDSSLSHPLLRDADPEALLSSISSRLSLSSSSSSCPEHEEKPRLSLDSEKPQNPPRVRISRPRPSPPDEHFTSRVGRGPVHRTSEIATLSSARGVSVDSPRMDPSGRIIFEGLWRSSSSPSSFNGVPRAKHRGMRRSYSANVRVPSVLNVPVCSLRGSTKSVSVFGFGQLFLQPRKEREGSFSSSVAPAAARAANAAGLIRRTTEQERKRDLPRARRGPGGL